VKAEATSTCQTCGARVPAGLDFCPVCALLRAGGQESAPSEALNPASDSERNCAETEPASTVRRFENYEVMLDQDGNPIELGRGAMGITYKAFDIDLRFPVTLKVISEKYVGDESARLRFLREARAAAKVRHPNVASVFHLGRIGGSYFYAMEFVEGETLESLIKRSGRLEVKLALEITTQVAAGLVAVNKQKLVHRDIKPSNIIVALEPGGAVSAKIIDLGLAKGASEPGSGSEISTPGAFAGTPAFASPEQFAGLGADIRSDLYSLGVTLWEMLAGQVPFRGSPSELMHEHQHTPLPLEQVKGVLQPVVTLLEVLLEKDPVQRFQNPAELLRAISLVAAALNAGRSLTPQDLRAISGERPAALQKTGKFSEPVRALFRSPRVRLLAWLVSGLVICGTVILAVNGFFRVNHPPLKSPVAPSALIEAPEKSIAVLPFDNISPNKDDAYFADGVQDEILNNLAKIAQLKVISRTSVMQYRSDTKRDLRQIASALGVANVLEGTVRRDGNHVRVSNELVDARNDNMIWADSYDRDLTDIFAIQSEVAQTVASKLGAQLSPKEKEKIEGKPTDSLEAYDLYLQAKELFANVDLFYMKDPRADLLKGIEYLQEAIRGDSKFALAYCLLANAHDYLYNGNFDSTTVDFYRTPERRALSDAAIAEALRLRPDLPEVHLAAAYHLYACYRDYERARVQIAIAQRALPNSPDALALAAYLDRRQGRWLESTTGFQKAITLDPRNPQFLSALADNYLSLRRYNDYEQTYDRLIELEPDKPILIIQKAFSAVNGKGDLMTFRAALERLPTSVKDDVFVVSFEFAYALSARDWAMAKDILRGSTNAERHYFNANGAIPRGCLEIYLAYLQGGRPAMEAEFATGRQQLNRKAQAHPEDASLLSALAVIDAALGRKSEAIEEAKRAVEMLPVSEDAVDGPSLLYNLAAVYGMMNERDLAFQELAVSAKIPGSVKYGELKLDACWDPLRNDPRFDKLLAELAPKD
jgi:serine/threonine protein kinase/Flp pilus assembly protein TadD